MRSHNDQVSFIVVGDGVVISGVISFRFTCGFRRFGVVADVVIEECALCQHNYYANVVSIISLWRVNKRLSDGHGNNNAYWVLNLIRWPR